MAWWDFLRRTPKDRIDGYAPKDPPQLAGRASDPWAQPDVVQQIEARVAQGGARFDAQHLDSYKNELTGIGDWLRDKTFGGKQAGLEFVVQYLSGYECMARWRGSDLGGRIVEAIPDEMTREGWDLSVQPSKDDKTDAFPPGGQPPNPALALLGAAGAKKPGVLPEADDEGPEIVEATLKELDRIGAGEAFWEALCYRRAYGGGAILLGANDGQQDLTQPLDEDRISSIDFLNTLMGGWDGEVVAWSYYNDPRKPNHGKPEIYMVRNIGVPIVKVPAPGSTMPMQVMPAPSMGRSQDYGTTIFWIHESRLLTFPGVAVSHWARTQMRGWGDSMFVRIDRVLSQFDQTWGGVALLMQEFSQGILKIDGLAEMLGANNKGGTTALSTRARALQLARSLAGVLLIDGEEDFSRDTASLAGVADVLTQFAYRLAAAADMPVNLLFGQMVSGALNKGDTDYRFFADRIAAKQKREMLPQMQRLLKLLFKSKAGPTQGVEPKKWSVDFRSLYQMTAKEEAEVRKIHTDADVAAIQSQQVTPEEVAATRYGGSKFNTGNIVVDYAGRKAMADQDAADKAKREKAIAEAAKNPPTPPPDQAPPKQE